MDGNSSPTTASIEKDVHYSNESTLNTLDLWVSPTQDKSQPDTFWIIFIHGGAWRDPTATKSDFLPAIQHIASLHSSALNHPNTTTTNPLWSHIHGCASLNYRLSPYPSHATDPSNPSDPARNVRHPEHVNDVIDAIEWLQRRFGFGERYVLVGHSAGATLGFQVAMSGGRRWGSGEHEEGGREGSGDGEVVVQTPMGIVGLDGIYDLEGLVDAFRAVPFYRQFVENAFGDDVRAWKAASPRYGRYKETWSHAAVVGLVVMYDGDNLIDEGQEYGMAMSLEEDFHSEHPSSKSKDAQFVLLRERWRGDHDDAWREYGRMVGFVEKCMERIWRASAEASALPKTP